MRLQLHQWLYGYTASKCLGYACLGTNHGFSSLDCVPLQTNSFEHYFNFVLYTEYDKVHFNMNNIITTLKSTPDTTDMLTGMYKQKGWVNITVHLTEDQLVSLALDRIKQDPKQYDLFIDMLHDIPGMDLTVNSVTSC